MKKKLYLFLIRLLLKFHNYSYLKASVFAVKLEDGLHPKHRITKYHKYFTDRVKRSDKVLDIGCGNGFNTLKIAEVAGQVIGIDNDRGNIDIARKACDKDNTEFIFADINEYRPGKKYNKIILSNVLEHIDDRITALKKLKEIGDTLLIRVPLFNRDWITTYKQELGIEYRLDKTHYIEYTLKSFKEELKAAMLELKSFEIKFGELFAEVE